jgi:hypothetical protein
LQNEAVQKERSLEDEGEESSTSVQLNPAVHNSW